MTIARATLAEAVYQAVGLSRGKCRDLVDQAFAVITTALVLGETVGITRFGSFTVQRRGQRIGRDAKTGEPVTIGPRKRITFRPSNALKGKVGRQ
jgi:integration host factor subunit alpha